MLVLIGIAMMLGGGFGTLAAATWLGRQPDPWIQRIGVLIASLVAALCAVAAVVMLATAVVSYNGLGQLPFGALLNAIVFASLTVAGIMRARRVLRQA